jgi:hypothetical protein
MVYPWTVTTFTTFTFQSGTSLLPYWTLILMMIVTFSWQENVASSTKTNHGNCWQFNRRQLEQKPDKALII